MSSRPSDPPFPAGSPAAKESSTGAPPPFGCEVIRERDHVRVAPFGELDIATVPELAQTLLEVRAAGTRHLIVDLRKLTFMDSSGLRLLLQQTTAAREHAHRFELIAGPPEVQRLFALTDTSAWFHFISPET